MKKNDWRYLVDTLLFISMFGIFFIGILMAFFLAEGPTVREQDKYFLSLHRHQWGDIHLILSLVFSILIVIHLILAWDWIKANAKRIFKNKAGQILILTLVGSVLILFLSWVITPKYSSEYLDYGFRGGGNVQAGVPLEGDENTALIHGRMTLLDLEKTTGIPASTIIRHLKLPSDVSFDDTLGQLRKKYGFSIVQLRNIINKISPSPPEETARQKESHTKTISQKKTDSESPVKSALKPVKKAPPISSRKKKHTETSEEKTKTVYGRLEEEGTGLIITGQMSLREILTKTGTESAKILEALNLPKNTPLDESLGRLRRKYGFTMQQFRDILTQLLEKKE